ncbi:MAG: chorismate synthase [Nitrospinota bacterium]
MAGNSFGNLLTLTTWGESHGEMIGGVLDGCPAGLRISLDDIQKEIDRRRPGQSKITTQRRESDKVKIVSGLMDSVTTGAPISFLIENEDKDSSAYEKIKDVYRPGHADYTYDAKYGIRDWRGGGRSSARETAVRVAAGAIAKSILAGVTITGYTVKICVIKMESFNADEIEKNAVRCPDPKAAAEMIKAIEAARKDKDSLGGIVEVRAKNVPPGLGMPVYHKLNAGLASALMGINAVKGVEIGDGFKAAVMKGSEFNDEMEPGDGGPGFKTNHAGGILGGISNGSDIVVRIAVKPTPSLPREQMTVDKNGNAVSVIVEGRHDPCICPRVVPVAEAMVALTLADHVLLNRAVRI